jgi:putative ABC transport system substrate-binding protein
MWPFAARAQPAERQRRIGVLMGTSETDAYFGARIAALRETLQKLGWTERLVRMDYRWAEGDAARLQFHARELIALAPDVLLAAGSTPMTVLGRETRTIPIVFANASDPLGSGLIASLAKPGGNVTGFATSELSVAGKWLDILKEIAPRTDRVAVVFNPQTAPGSRSQFLRSLEAAAASLRLRGLLAPVVGVSDIEELGNVLGPEPGGAMLVWPDIFTTTHRKLLVEVAFRNRLPAVYRDREFVLAGGLISYGSDLQEVFRQAASYVDRILKGEKPADLPVQQPTKLELVVNLKTARAIGLKIPESFLLRADEVIE